MTKAYAYAQHLGKLSGIAPCPRKRWRYATFCNVRDLFMFYVPVERAIPVCRGRLFGACHRMCNAAEWTHAAGCPGTGRLRIFAPIGEAENGSPDRDGKGGDGSAPRSNGWLFIG